MVMDPSVGYWNFQIPESRNMAKKCFNIGYRINTQYSYKKTEQHIARKSIYYNVKELIWKSHILLLC